MPTYLYHCERCERDDEAWHTMKQCDTFVLVCPDCGRRMKRLPQVAGMRVMARGWEALNGGRGQYISQLEDKPTGKPTDAAHCRSMAELHEKAARKGFDVHRTGF